MVVRSLLTLLGFQSDDKGLNKYGNALKKVMDIGKMAVLGISVLGGIALKTAGDMEQVQIAFETMLGSAEAANDLIEDITKFAATTPFELTGLVKSSKQLLAFGFAAEEIIPTMTTMGNIAAGVGKDKLPTIVAALGKIRAKGKASMEELNMMLEAGVPILDELAKNYGVTTQELFKMVSAGKVSFKEVNQALTNMGTGTGRFAGLMEKQSKSFLGILSNIGDFFTNFMNAVGQELLPIGKELGRAFLDFLAASQGIMKSGLVDLFKGLAYVVVFVIRFIQRLIEHLGGLEKLTSGFMNILKTIGRVLLTVGKIAGKVLLFVIDLVNDVVNFFGGWEKVLEVLLPIIIGIIAAIQLWGVVQAILHFIMSLNPITLIIIAIFALIVAIKLLIDNWDAVITFLKGLWEGFAGFFVDLWMGSINFLKKAGEVMMKLWSAFADWIGKVWEGISTNILGIWDGIVAGIKSVWEGTVKFITGLWEGLMTFINGVADVAAGVGDFFGGLFGGGKAKPTMENKTSGSSSSNMNNFDVRSKINVNLPPGTTEEQAKEMEFRMKKIITDQWGTVMGEVTANSPK